MRYLLILVARLLFRQGYFPMGMALLHRISNRTQSYFWAFEVGYFAIARGENRLADAAFEKAEQLAAVSDVKFDRYAPGMPPPRSPNFLQLLPEFAVQIAQWFRWRLATGDFR